MVASLLKSARELDTYAKEAEYATAKLMQVLEPMLLSYDEELPQIPEKIPLTAYPLDFVAPEGMYVAFLFINISGYATISNTVSLQ